MVASGSPGNCLRSHLLLITIGRFKMRSLWRLVRLRSQPKSRLRENQNKEK